MNNDLIYRDCAKEAIRREWEADHDAGMIDYLAALEQVPAVKQPMSAVEYEQAIDRLVRWCNERPCDCCEYNDNCIRAREETPEQRVEAMRKWVQKHLERSEE